MRIGIDIDDTITNTQVEIDKIAREVENLNIHDKSKHWLRERYNCEEGYDDEFFKKHASNIMMDASLKDKADYYINKLYDDGNEIYFITARSEKYSKDIPDITIAYLKDHGIKYNKILFASQNKGEICMEHNIDLFIDDDEGNLEEVMKVGIKAIVIDNEYNRNCKAIRAYTWEEVYNLIRR